MKKPNSKNPNNDVYWKARGYEKRPKNWKDLISEKNDKRPNKKEYIDSSGGITDYFWKDDY